MGSGAMAGAVTTALNAATYLDMAVRGRPSSSTPQKTVERGADLLGVSVPGDDDARQARVSGLAPLLGTATGVGAGLVLGAMRSAGWPRSRKSTLATAWILAMVAGNGPMTALGVTDPRNWSANFVAGRHRPACRLMRSLPPRLWTTSNADPEPRATSE